jgi:hypothetical protein
MSVIKGLLEEELSRNRRMQNRYSDEIKVLPKGSLMIRKIGSKEYCYYKYRSGRKVITDYIGKKQDVDLESIIKLITRRQELEILINKLKHEEKEIIKMLR